MKSLEALQLQVFIANAQAHLTAEDYEETAATLRSLSRLIDKLNEETDKGVIPVGVAATTFKTDPGLRMVSIHIDAIFALIADVGEWGSTPEILLSLFHEWTGKVTDEEIHEYANNLQCMEGFGPEDYTYAKEQLEAWRKDFGET